MDNKTGFVLSEIKNITAPMLVCESCGETIRNYKMAWIMWPSLLQDGAVVKPTFLCKKNGCNAKPPYDGYPSMELGAYLVNLLRNSGLKSEEDLREAFELAHLGDQV